MRQFLPLLAIVSVCLLGCNPAVDSIDGEMEQAWTLLRGGEGSTADARFARCAVAAKSARDKAWALYGRAMVRVNEADTRMLDEADSFLESAIAADPKGDAAPWAELAVARQLSLRLELIREKRMADPANVAVRSAMEALNAKAEKAYEAVSEKYPGHPAGDEAATYQMTLLLDRVDPAAAGRVTELVDRFAQERPDSPWLTVAYGLRGNACTLRKDPDGLLASALKGLEASHRLDPSAVQDQSWAYFNIASIAEHQAGDFATARTYYTKFITEYPQEQRVLTARQALVRMDACEARMQGVPTTQPSAKGPR